LGVFNLAVNKVNYLAQIFLISGTCVTKIKEYLKMKIASYNSNSISFVTGKEIRSTFEFTQDKSVNRSEKRHTKGMVKSFLGMVYFAALMYSIFILLT